MGVAHRILVCDRSPEDSHDCGHCPRRRTCPRRRFQGTGPNESLVDHIQGKIARRGLNASVSATGCINACNTGPAMVVYPMGWKYGGLDEEKIDQILDALMADQPAEGLLAS